MSKIKIEKVEDGIDLARRMAEEEKGVGRKPDGRQKSIIPTLAVCWSLFQLSLPKWLLLAEKGVKSAVDLLLPNAIFNFTLTPFIFLFPFISFYLGSSGSFGRAYRCDNLPQGNWKTAEVIKH